MTKTSWYAAARVRTSIWVAMLLFVAAPSCAFDLPSSWTVQQKQWFQAMQLSPAFQTHGIPYLQSLQAAKENLRLHRRIRSCPGITVSDADGLLDSSYRRVVENGPTKAREQVLDREGKILQYLEGPALWAFRLQTPAELDLFLRLNRGPPAKRAVALLAQVTFLEHFASVSNEYQKLDLEPAAVIWLKQYFKQEGASSNLESAVAAAAPHLLADFQRVGSFEAHTARDGEWLRALAGRVAQSSHSIANQLWLLQPADEQTKALEILSLPAFSAMGVVEGSMQLDLARRMRTQQMLGLRLSVPSGAVPMEDSGKRFLAPLELLRPRLWPDGVASLPAIANAVNAAYPEPAELDQATWSMGPADYLGRASVDGLCASDAK